MSGPVNRMVRKLPGVHYTVSEAGVKVGRSVRTLKRWAAQDETLRPSKRLVQGGLTVALYTDDDVERLRRHARKGA